VKIEGVHFMGIFLIKIQIKEYNQLAFFSYLRRINTKGFITGGNYDL
jgi:hypothetical protein